MRAPRLTTRTKSLGLNTRTRPPRNRVPAPKVPGSRPDVGARKASARDEREDGEMGYRKGPRAFRVSFGDTGLQADDFE